MSTLNKKLKQLNLHNKTIKIPHENASIVGNQPPEPVGNAEIKLLNNELMFDVSEHGNIVEEVAVSVESSIQYLP